MADSLLRQPLVSIATTRANQNTLASVTPANNLNKRNYESAALDTKLTCHASVTPTKTTATVTNGRRSVKRVKTDLSLHENPDLVNERLRARQEEEYAVKLKQWAQSYRKQFPNLKFYFDGCPEEDVRRCTRRIETLGGAVERFFSNKVNLLVTTREVPQPGALPLVATDKPSRNISQQLQAYKHTGHTGRVAHSATQALTHEIVPRTDSQCHDVLFKAQALGIKIWTLKKLQDSVLKILLGDSTQAANQRTLSNTLHTEKYLGTNQENVVHFRGPFLLVRDMDEYYKPIMCREWPKVSNAKDGEWPQWRNTRPGRCPFIRDKPAEQKKPPVQVTQPKQERPRTLSRFQYANASGIQQITSAIQSNIGRSGWSGKENIGSSIQSLQKKAVTAKRATRMNPNIDQADTKKGTATVDLKSGFCENCKDKFDDFDEHLQTHTHRAYAKDEKNFYQLDALLEEVVRAPRAEYLHL